MPFPIGKNDPIIRLLCELEAPMYLITFAFYVSFYAPGSKFPYSMFFLL